MAAVYVSTCSKCGVTNDGLLPGSRPCNERVPPENHVFIHAPKPQLGTYNISYFQYLI